MASVDHRSAAEIERDIEDERDALTRTLDEIHDRLSFESLSGEFVDRIREGGGDMGRSIARTARDNPVPLALAALGVAWLVASKTAARVGDAREPWSAPAAGRAPADRRTLVDPAPLYDSSGRPLARDDTRWDTAEDDTDDRLTDEAASRISQASDAVRRQARGAQASAAELRRRITQGTEDLSHRARKRVLAARTRAYEAQLRAERYASRGREKAGDLYEEQPLVAGALALAIGAAIGGLMPRTKHEDAAFGEYSDRAFDEAERIYREERAKMETKARDAAREMKNTAADVASQVTDNLQEGAARAGDIAREKLSEASADLGSAADDSVEGPDDGKPKLRRV